MVQTESESRPSRPVHSQSTDSEVVYRVKEDIADQTIKQVMAILHGIKPSTNQPNDVTLGPTPIPGQ